MLRCRRKRLCLLLLLSIYQYLKILYSSFPPQTFSWTSVKLLWCGCCCSPVHERFAVFFLSIHSLLLMYQAVLLQVKYNINIYVRKQTRILILDYTKYYGISAVLFIPFIDRKKMYCHLQYSIRQLREKWNDRQLMFAADLL